MSLLCADFLLEGSRLRIRLFLESSCGLPWVLKVERLAGVVRPQMGFAALVG